MLQSLGRLLLQGMLRVVLVAVTTASVIGFLSIVAVSSQEPEPSVADAKTQRGACMPSQCRAQAASRSPQATR